MKSSFLLMLASRFKALWADRAKREALLSLLFVVAVVVIVCVGMAMFKHRAESRKASFQEDLAYVRSLCAIGGGDRIYRRVDNVEGVLQMKSRNPDGVYQWADQFGMAEPWALAFGDTDRGAVELGIRGAGYWFIEHRSPHGALEGSAGRRQALVSTATRTKLTGPEVFASAEGFLMDRRQLKVTTTVSRYGYTTEDLTTEAMRRRWIAGGRLKIIDLQTNEVLAERVGFYRAMGPAYKMAWAAGTSCRSDELTYFQGFIKSVLRPPVNVPTELDLKRINSVD